MPWKAIWRLPWITCPFASRQRNRERAASQFSLPNKVKYNDNIPPWCTLCSRAKLNFWLQTASFFDIVNYSANLMYLSVMLYFKWHLLLFCFSPTVYWILFYGRPYHSKVVRMLDWWSKSRSLSDWVLRSVVENEDIYGWDYRLINENHDRYII